MLPEASSVASGVDAGVVLCRTVDTTDQESEMVLVPHVCDCMQDKQKLELHSIQALVVDVVKGVRQVAHQLSGRKESGSLPSIFTCAGVAK